MATSWRTVNDQVQEVGSSANSGPLAALQGACPTVVSGLLSVCTHEEGKSQLSFGVYGEGGVLKVSLKDRENGMFAILVLSDPVDLWSFLEAAVASGTIDWRYEKAQRGRKS